ncbi:MAG TPA: hypothetical protein DD706_16085 [Nitrospiraceae bacterium]|nr:hypothetical protein [Nitrospiraceae bacterium]
MQSMSFLEMPGFVPANEVLLFRQKDPKPWWPRRGPSGALRRVVDSGGAQTRCAQTMRAFLRSRRHDLAAPQGHRTSIMLRSSVTNLGITKTHFTFPFGLIRRLLTGSRDGRSDHSADLV